MPGGVHQTASCASSAPALQVNRHEFALIEVLQHKTRQCQWGKDVHAASPLPQSIVCISRVLQSICFALPHAVHAKTTTPQPTVPYACNHQKLGASSHPCPLPTTQQHDESSGFYVPVSRCSAYRWASAREACNDCTTHRLLGRFGSGHPQELSAEYIEHVLVKVSGGTCSASGSAVDVASPEVSGRLMPMLPSQVSTRSCIWLRPELEEASSVAASGSTSCNQQPTWYQPVCRLK